MMKIYLGFLIISIFMGCAPKPSHIETEPKDLNLELGQTAKIRLFAISEHGEKFKDFRFSAQNLYFDPSIVDLLYIEDGSLVVAARECGDESVPITWKDHSKIISASVRIRIPCKPVLMENSSLKCSGDICTDKDTGCVYWAGKMTPRYDKDGNQQGCGSF